MAKKLADSGKRQQIAGPGRVVDRSVRKGKLKVAFDPSPDGFVTEARREKDRLTVTIYAEGMKPIEIVASPKLWVFQFEQASIPADRLAELESIIEDEMDCHVTIHYIPSPKLPGLDLGGGDAADE